MKPLTTEAEHKEALREIEDLWGAKEGSPEGDRLEILTAVVETYEEAHFPIDLPSPLVKRVRSLPSHS